jgi:hypothetical protein
MASTRSFNGIRGIRIEKVKEYPSAESHNWDYLNFQPSTSSFSPMAVAAVVTIATKVVWAGTQIASAAEPPRTQYISIEKIVDDVNIDGQNEFYRKNGNDELCWNTFKSLKEKDKNEVAEFSLAEKSISEYNGIRGMIEAESENIERKMGDIYYLKSEFMNSISKLKDNFTTRMSQAPLNLSENFFSDSIRKYVKETYNNFEHLYGNAKKVTKDKIYRMAIAERMDKNGFSQAQISEYLGVSAKTIKSYLTDIGKHSRDLRMEKMAKASRNRLEEMIKSTKSYSGRFA